MYSRNEAAPVMLGIEAATELASGGATGATAAALPTGTGADPGGKDADPAGVTGSGFVGVPAVADVARCIGVDVAGLVATAVWGAVPCNAAISVLIATA